MIPAIMTDVSPSGKTETGLFTSYSRHLRRHQDVPPSLPPSLPLSDAPRLPRRFHSTASMLPTLLWLPLRLSLPLSLRAYASARTHTRMHTLGREGNVLSFSFCGMCDERAEFRQHGKGRRNAYRPDAKVRRGGRKLPGSHKPFSDFSASKCMNSATALTWLSLD